MAFPPIPSVEQIAKIRNRFFHEVFSINVVSFLNSRSLKQFPHVLGKESKTKQKIMDMLYDKAPNFSVHKWEEKIIDLVKKLNYDFHGSRYVMDPKIIFLNHLYKICSQDCVLTVEELSTRFHVGIINCFVSSVNMFRIFESYLEAHFPFARGSLCVMDQITGGFSFFQLPSLGDCPLYEQVARVNYVWRNDPFFVSR